MLVSIAIDGEGQREDHGGVLKKITSFCPPDRTSYERRLTCSSIFDSRTALESGTDSKANEYFVSKEGGERREEGEQGK